jgi:hypothetical protein
MEVSCCEPGPSAVDAVVAGPFKAHSIGRFGALPRPTSVDAAVRGKLFYGRASKDEADNLYGPSFGPAFFKFNVFRARLSTLSKLCQIVRVSLT